MVIRNNFVYFSVTQIRYASLDNYIFGYTIIFHKLHDCEIFDIDQGKTAVNGKRKGMEISMNKTKKHLGHKRTGIVTRGFCRL